MIAALMVFVKYSVIIFFAYNFHSANTSMFEVSINLWVISALVSYFNWFISHWVEEIVHIFEEIYNLFHIFSFSCSLVNIFLILMEYIVINTGKTIKTAINVINLLFKEPQVLSNSQKTTMIHQLFALFLRLSTSLLKWNGESLTIWSISSFIIITIPEKLCCSETLAAAKRWLPSMIKNSPLWTNNLIVLGRSPLSEFITSSKEKAPKSLSLFA